MESEILSRKVPKGVAYPAEHINDLKRLGGRG